ncbi:MAG: hypothetical protein NC909_01730 [Candidatus Omnitrophica bacterium]|nr:hypothetical protein [Candidatus Omnitrophota bacterium]
MKTFEKVVDYHQRSIFVVLSIVIFLFIQSYLLLRWHAEIAVRKAKDYLSQLEGLDKNLFIKRASLYSKALKLYKRAILFNALDSRYYFEYSRRLLEIFTEKELREMLNIYLDIPDILTHIQWYIFKAVTLEPLNSKYHLFLAYFYGLRSNKENVQEELRKAYILDSRNIENGIYIIRYFLNNNLPYKAIYYLDKVEYICKELNYSFDSCKEIRHLREKMS